MKQKIKEPAVKQWEIKDRLYELTTEKIPVTHIVKSKNLYYFDEEAGHEREMKYCKNQKTVFVDEMKGPQRLGHIIFRDGMLYVPKNEVTLQKLLSLYHPDANRKFAEVDNEVKAETDLDILELEIEALNAAKQMEVDQMEAILRTELGSKVSSMKSKELKRDLLIFAKSNPQLFLELANDDNINIRNMGIKAVEASILTLSNDQRTFTWTKTGKKIVTVPFDENAYSALAAFFKTDEGIEVYKSIEKKLK